MSDLEALARAGVEAALSAGAGEAEAWCEESTSRRVEVYDGEVESLSDAGSRGIGVRAFLDGRAGYAYGTDLGDEGLRALGAAAFAAAEVADPDEHAGLPEEASATNVEGLSSTAMSDWSTEDKVALALAIARAARATSWSSAAGHAAVPPTVSPRMRTCGWPTPAATRWPAFPQKPVAMARSPAIPSIAASASTPLPTSVAPRTGELTRPPSIR